MLQRFQNATSTLQAQGLIAFKHNSSLPSNSEEKKPTHGNRGKAWNLRIIRGREENTPFWTKKFVVDRDSSCQHKESKKVSTETLLYKVLQCYLRN
jgi:hypothetical protein